MKVFAKEEIINSFKSFFNNLSTLFGRENGLATLDDNGKVPLNQINDSIFNDHIQYADNLPANNNIKNVIYAVPHIDTIEESKETTTLDIIGSYTTMQSKDKYVVDSDIVLTLGKDTIRSMFVSGSTVSLYTGNFTGLLSYTIKIDEVKSWQIQQTTDHFDYFCGNETLKTLTKLANVEQVETWFIRKSEKGTPGGVAILNSNGKIPLNELSFNTLIFLGLSSNLTSDINSIEELTSGMFFIINAEHTYNEVKYYPGDWCIYDGTSWSRQANTNIVSSVNGQIGTVTINGDNIDVTYENSTDTLNNTLPKLGKVKKVNGNGPDENGNIVVDAVIETSELPSESELKNNVYKVENGWEEIGDFTIEWVSNSSEAEDGYYYGYPLYVNPGFSFIEGQKYTITINDVEYEITPRYEMTFLKEDGTYDAIVYELYNGYLCFGFVSTDTSHYKIKLKGSTGIRIYAKDVKLATKYDLDAKADSDNVVTLDGDQTISGTKTFTGGLESTLFVKDDMSGNQKSEIKQELNKIDLRLKNDIRGIEASVTLNTQGSYSELNLGADRVYAHGPNEVVTSVNGHYANNTGEIIDDNLGINNLGKINESITKQWTASTFIANNGFQLGGGSEITKGMSPTGIYVDTGSAGKWLERDNTGWAVQINAGTSFYMPVVAEGTITVTYYSQGTKTYNVNKNNMVTVSGQNGKFYKIDCSENDYIGTITYNYTSTDFALKTVDKDVEILGSVILQNKGEEIARFRSKDGTISTPALKTYSDNHTNLYGSLKVLNGNYIKLYDSDDTQQVVTASFGSWCTYMHPICFWVHNNSINYRDVFSASCYGNAHLGRDSYIDIDQCDIDVVGVDAVHLRSRYSNIDIGSGLYFYSNAQTTISSGSAGICLSARGSVNIDSGCDSSIKFQQGKVQINEYGSLELRGYRCNNEQPIAEIDRNGTGRFQKVEIGSVSASDGGLAADSIYGRTISSNYISSSTINTDKICSYVTSCSGSLNVGVCSGLHIEGNTGYWGDIFVDARSGKLKDNGGGWNQFNTGTILYVPVKGSGCIGITTYSANTSCIYNVGCGSSIGGQLSCRYFYSSSLITNPTGVPAGTYLKITATSNDYIKCVTANYTDSGYKKVIDFTCGKANINIPTNINCLTVDTELSIKTDLDLSKNLNIETTGSILAGTATNTKTSNWDFSSSSLVADLECEKTLNYHGSTYGAFSSSNTIYVPASGSGTLTVTVGYSWDISVAGKTENQVPDGGSNVNKSFSYTAANLVTRSGKTFLPITIGSTTTYIKAIKITDTFGDKAVRIGANGVKTNVLEVTDCIDGNVNITGNVNFTGNLTYAGTPVSFIKLISQSNYNNLSTACKNNGILYLICE